MEGQGTRKNKMMHTLTLMCAAVAAMCAVAYPLCEANAADAATRGTSSPSQPGIFRIDSSKAPEKAEWAEKELKPALEAYAGKVVELLDGKWRSGLAARSY